MSLTVIVNFESSFISESIKLGLKTFLVITAIPPPLLANRFMCIKQYIAELFMQRFRKKICVIIELSHVSIRKTVSKTSIAIQLAFPSLLFRIDLELICQIWIVLSHLLALVQFSVCPFGGSLCWCFSQSFASSFRKYREIHTFADQKSRFLTNVAQSLEKTR